MRSEGATLSTERHGLRRLLLPIGFGVIMFTSTACQVQVQDPKTTPLAQPPSFASATGASGQPVEGGIPVARPYQSDEPSPPSTAASIPADSLFDTGSYELRLDATSALKKVATEILQLDPGATMQFVGHADSRGDAASNQLLSERRAQTVLEWFRGHGFANNKLSATGVGSTQPVIPDTDPGGAFNEAAGQKNRRVDVIIEQ